MKIIAKTAIAAAILALAVAPASADTILIDFEGSNGFSNFGTMPSTYQPIDGVNITYTNVGTYVGNGDWNTWQRAGAGNGPQAFSFDQGIRINSLDVATFDPSAQTVTVTAYSDEAGTNLLGSFNVFDPTRGGSQGQNYNYQTVTDLAQYGYNVRRLEVNSFGGTNPNGQLNDLSISTIPEPTTGFLFAAGLGTCLLRRRRRA